MELQCPLIAPKAEAAHTITGIKDPAVVQYNGKYHVFASTAGSSLLVEAIGSHGRRYFRSWTSGSLAGSWTHLAASESNPFARANNVSFPSPARRLQYLYQGLNPDAGGAHDVLPRRLGLLTQTNPTC
ncbi:non-reducing end alpha-L-arabinofuranosidase family hydrolase [Streptomyces iakyrus]|uniref:non-reducing end alpha-L-arabinofuranosidase family hydrolase n=1 Tax=Streptomyces iakyrus TaxID=68219 RepID=UPI0036CD50B2